MILAGLFIEYIANNFFLDILGQRLHFYSSVCVCVLEKTRRKFLVPK